MASADLASMTGPVAAGAVADAVCPCAVGASIIEANKTTIVRRLVNNCIAILLNNFTWTARIRAEKTRPTSVQSRRFAGDIRRLPIPQFSIDKPQPVQIVARV